MIAANIFPRDLCRPLNLNDDLEKSSIRFSEPETGQLIDLPFMEWEDEETELDSTTDSEPEPTPAENHEDKRIGTHSS